MRFCEVSLSSPQRNIKVSLRRVAKHLSRSLAITHRLIHLPRHLVVEDLHDSKVKSSEAQVLIFKKLAKCLAERRDVEFVAQENEGGFPCWHSWPTFSCNIEFREPFPWRFATYLRLVRLYRNSVFHKITRGAPSSCYLDLTDSLATFLQKNAATKHPSALHRHLVKPSEETQAIFEHLCSLLN